MCENEFCACQSQRSDALADFLDIWEANYTVGEETEFYKQNPHIRTRLNELDRNK